MNTSIRFLALAACITISGLTAPVQAGTRAEDLQGARSNLRTAMSSTRSGDYESAVTAVNACITYVSDAKSNSYKGFADIVGHVKRLQKLLSAKGYSTSSL